MHLKGARWPPLISSRIVSDKVRVQCCGRHDVQYVQSRTIKNIYVAAGPWGLAMGRHWSWEPDRLWEYKFLVSFTPPIATRVLVFFFTVLPCGPSSGARSSGQGKMEHTLSIGEELIRSPRATVVSFLCVSGFGPPSVLERKMRVLIDYLTSADRTRADVTANGQRHGRTILEERRVAGCSGHEQGQPPSFRLSLWYPRPLSGR